MIGVELTTTCEERGVKSRSSQLKPVGSPCSRTNLRRSCCSRGASFGECTSPRGLSKLLAVAQLGRPRRNAGAFTLGASRPRGGAPRACCRVAGRAAATARHTAAPRRRRDALGGGGGRHADDGRDGQRGCRGRGVSDGAGAVLHLGQRAADVARRVHGVAPPHAVVVRVVCGVPRARALPRAGGRAARRRRDAHPRAARRRLQRQRAHLRRLPQPRPPRRRRALGRRGARVAPLRLHRHLGGAHGQLPAVGVEPPLDQRPRPRRRRLRRRHRPRHAALGDGGAAAGGPPRGQSDHGAAVLGAPHLPGASPRPTASARAAGARAASNPPPPAAAALTPSVRARALRWASCCGRTASWRTP